MVEQPQKKQRRMVWFRLTCRLVFLVILILLVHAVQNGRAILNLKSLNEVDFYTESGFLLGSLPVSWQSWLYNTLGKDRLMPFETATQFDCSTKTDLNDTELALLCEFKNLKSLYLNSNEITNAGLSHIKMLVKLEKLHLKNSQVTDAGLIHLNGLTNLFELDLSGTQVSDAGLVHLKELRKLYWFNLDKTQVQDAGLIHLKEFLNLKVLVLRDTQISDSGLIHLKRIPKLEGIDLSGTQISDAGLIHLKGLKKLKFLALHNTQVTAAGVAQLQASNPGCQIRYTRAVE